MGDILKKLQMVCEKIGVTETAHTIEEQVDLISESLDKIPASTNIAEALDDLSEVAQNINNEEVYVDKTITANGEYLPAEDEATAYSKVTVNVNNTPAFNNISYFSIPMGQSNPVLQYTVYNQSDNNGTFNVKFTTNASVGSNHLLSSPATKVVCDFDTPTGVIQFTPSENFDGFYKAQNDTKLDVAGDTITPNDKKVYKAELSAMTNTATITCWGDGYTVDRDLNS